LSAGDGFEAALERGADFAGVFNFFSIVVECAQVRRGF